MTKTFEEAGGQAMSLVLLRTLAGITVFGAAVAVARVRLPSRRLIAIGIGLGAFQFTSSCALVVGYATAPASLVVLAFYVYPVVVVIAASMFLGESVGWQRGLLVVVGISGLLLAVGPPESASIAGIGLGLVAGLGMSCLVLGNRYLYQRGVAVPHVLALTYVAPTLGLLAVLGTGAISLPPAQTDVLIPAAAFVTISAVIPIALFALAVRNVGAGTAALLTTIEPFAAVVIAFFLLGESLTALQLLGGVLIASAAALLSILPATGASSAASATPSPAVTTRV
jgi:drug/metabolite transporter (DMT)-like permease